MFFPTGKLKLRESGEGLEITTFQKEGRTLVVLEGDEGVLRKAEILISDVLCKKGCSVRTLRSGGLLCFFFSKEETRNILQALDVVTRMVAVQGIMKRD